jgi:hypothetical protein
MYVRQNTPHIKPSSSLRLARDYKAESHRHARRNLAYYAGVIRLTPAAAFRGWAPGLTGARRARPAAEALQREPWRGRRRRPRKDRPRPGLSTRRTDRRDGRRPRCNRTSACPRPGVHQGRRTRAPAAGGTGESPSIDTAARAHQVQPETVSFSCKQRGLCPSCGTRRAHEASAHLGALLPVAAWRQWTLSLPFRLRWAAVKKPSLLRQVERRLVRAVWAWQRKTARRLGHCLYPRARPAPARPGLLTGVHTPSTRTRPPSCPLARRRPGHPIRVGWQLPKAPPPRRPPTNAPPSSGQEKIVRSSSSASNSCTGVGCDNTIERCLPEKCAAAGSNGLNLVTCRRPGSAHLTARGHKHAAP